MLHEEWKIKSRSKAAGTKDSQRKIHSETLKYIEIIVFSVEVLSPTAKSREVEVMPGDAMPSRQPCQVILNILHGGDGYREPLCANVLPQVWVAPQG